MINIGTLVFLRIFNKNPELKALFPFRNSFGDELVSHPLFRSHAYRYASHIIMGITMA